MQSEYIYPQIADRSSPDDWQTKGAQDMWARAKTRVREILEDHYPAHLSDQADARIRERFPIRLPRSVMTAG